jgi:NAD(P)H-flavin reductase
VSAAPFGRRAARVVAAEDVGAYRVLHAEDPEAASPAPGQFFMLAAIERWGDEGGRPFLPRAFSVLRAQPGPPTRLQFLLDRVGPGTGRLVELGPGDGLWLTGPLGLGFRAPEDGRRAVLVGGGVGVPPLVGWQDALRAAGVAQRALVGVRDARHAAAAALLHEPRVATDDGSAGRHALVTALLGEELDADGHATVYACGPAGMLEAVRAICVERDVPGQLALESGMACGFGACFGCVVATHDAGYVRICVDGPVLAADRLVPGAIH